MQNWRCLKSLHRIRFIECLKESVATEENGHGNGKWISEENGNWTFLYNESDI